MRKSIPCISLFLGTVLLTSVVSAQQADRFAYAVTDLPEQYAQWNYLRKLNLQTGEFSSILLSGNDVSYLGYDAASKKQFTAPLNDRSYGNLVNAPFGTGVAAMAYDGRHNRLYYTPMFIDQLRYIDLKTMKVFYVTDQSFTNKPQKSPDQGNIVTRMVIASDGNGYAMTNDGMQLIQFTTGKKLQIVDMGSMVDDPASKGVSIHNSCSSYGGDMIADDDGNLYVFSARNHVFKINIESKVATHLGVISGLPTGFTVNAAAVNENNQVIVGSAVQSTSLFIVDTKSWKAIPMEMRSSVYHTSDLANGNFLISGKKPKSNNMDLISQNIDPNPGDNKISIFPNPVTSKVFRIQFDDFIAGSYTVQISDVTGRQVSQQVVNVGAEKQVQTVKLPASTTGGVYLVKITDAGNKTVYNSKIVVQ
jgi:Secretion system C-terminal sorting domain